MRNAFEKKLDPSSRLDLGALDLPGSGSASRQKFYLFFFMGYFPLSNNVIEIRLYTVSQKTSHCVIVCIFFKY